MMSIRHPLFMGRIETRLSQLQNHHRVQSKLYRNLTPEEIEEDPESFKNYLVAQEELYEQAHSVINQECSTDTPTTDYRSNERQKKNSEENVKETGAPGAKQASKATP